MHDKFPLLADFSSALETFFAQKPTGSVWRFCSDFADGQTLASDICLACRPTEFPLLFLFCHPDDADDPAVFSLLLAHGEPLFMSVTRVAEVVPISFTVHDGFSFFMFQVFLSLFSSPSQHVIKLQACFSLHSLLVGRR